MTAMYTDREERLLAERLKERRVREIAREEIDKRMGLSTTPRVHDDEQPMCSLADVFGG